MNNNQLVQLLTDYKSYKYALQNVAHLDTGLPLITATRLIKYSSNMWDGTRYSRIVGMIEGAVAELLTDDQRMVVQRKYFDRETVNLTDIAKMKNIHASSVSRWHKEALRRLSKALAPLSWEEYEINNIDHMLVNREVA